MSAIAVDPVCCRLPDECAGSSACACRPSIRDCSGRHRVPCRHDAGCCPLVATRPSSSDDSPLSMPDRPDPVLVVDRVSPPAAALIGIRILERRGPPVSPQEGRMSPFETRTIIRVSPSGPSSEPDLRPLLGPKRPAPQDAPTDCLTITWRPFRGGHHR